MRSDRKWATDLVQFPRDPTKFHKCAEAMAVPPIELRVPNQLSTLYGLCRLNLDHQSTSLLNQCLHAGESVAGLANALGKRTKNNIRSHTVAVLLQQICHTGTMGERFR